jgi:hypothetical protein
MFRDSEMRSLDTETNAPQAKQKESMRRFNTKVVTAEFRPAPATSKASTSALSDAAKVVPNVKRKGTQTSGQCKAPKKAKTVVKK